MKKYISIIILAGIASALALSCAKSNPTVDSTTSPAGFAFIKVSQFAPNFRGAFNNRDSFNVYVNNVKLNGSFFSFGSSYPTASNLYAAVPAGAVTIKLSVVGINGLSGTLGVDSIVVATINKTLTAGSYYSFIMTDSVMNASDSKQIFVQDNFTRADTTHYSIRFAHTILGDTAGKTVDVYSTRLAANIFSNISPGTVTPFIPEPYSLVSDTLIVKRTGTGFELGRISTVATPIARERAYTLVYKGIAGTIFNTTTAPKGRSLVYFTNQ